LSNPNGKRGCGGYPGVRYSGLLMCRGWAGGIGAGGLWDYQVGKVYRGDMPAWRYGSRSPGATGKAPKGYVLSPGALRRG